MRNLIILLEAKSKEEKLELIELKYASTALAPVISGSAFTYHRDKLAAGYVQRWNSGEGDPEFNFAGALLHNILFSQFRAPRNSNPPNGPIGGLIRSRFEDFETFVEKFLEEAMKLQGSGWVYLARDGVIKTIKNHAVKNDIVLLIDMWEHAFNLDYGADKKKYLQNIWKIIDWNVINTRYMSPYR